jgi:hypothetical protein
MEDLVEGEFSGFLGQGQNSDNRVQNQAKAMKLRTKPHLLSCSFYSPRPTNVLYCVRILGDPYEEAKERLHIGGRTSPTSPTDSYFMRAAKWT